MIAVGLATVATLVGRSEPLRASEPELRPESAESGDPLGEVQTGLRDTARLLRAGLPELAWNRFRDVSPERLDERGIADWAQIARALAGRLERPVPELAALVASVSRGGEASGALAVLAETEAILLLRSRRIADAILAWDRALRAEAEPDTRHVILQRAAGLLGREDPETLQAAPGIQAGGLREFLDRWAGRVVHSPESAEALLALEVRLDAESPEAERWAETALTLREASPRALLRRGALELRRSRNDRALPWLLWAASTDSLRSDVSPRSWRDLALVYHRLGWCEDARRAADLALEPRLADAPCDSGSAAAPLLDDRDCRDWHDDLLGSFPERLVVRWRDDWRASVPDLRIWNTRCRTRRPDPFDARRGRCSPRRGLPRTAAAELSRHWTLDRLLCTLESTLVPQPGVFDRWRTELDDAARSSPPGGLRGSRSDRGRALLVARIRFRLALRTEGPLAALGHLREALAPETSEHETLTLLSDALDGLAHAPSAPETAAALEGFYRAACEGRDPGRGCSELRLATALRTVAPRSERALRAAERAIVTATERARSFAWQNRAELELDRGREGSALPYLLWARSDAPLERPDVDPARSRFDRLARLSARIGAALGRSDVVLEERARLRGEPVPPLPADLLPRSGLGPACRRLAEHLAGIDASTIVQISGPDWRRRLPELREWERDCSSRLSPAEGPAPDGT